MLMMLKGFLHAMFKAFGESFITAEETIVGSCRQSTTANNMLENMGDETVTIGYGQVVVWQLVEIWVASADAAPQVAKTLCRNLVSNVHLGPVFSYIFGLAEFFTMRCSVNREAVAGMWEATLGAVMRHGSTLLFKHLVSWCAIVHLWCLRDDPAAMLENAAGTSAGAHYAACVNMGSGRVDIGSNGNALWLIDLPALTRTWMQSCLREMGGCLMVAAAGTMVPVDVPLSPYEKTKLEQVDSVPPMYFLRLRCHEWGCTSQGETPLVHDPSDTHKQAELMGWKKPTSQNWQHSRCPKCAW